MEEKQVFYLSDRWWWVGLSTLMFSLGISFFVRQEQVSFFAFGFLALYAIAILSCISLRVEIRETGLQLGGALSWRIKVSFDDIEHVEEVASLWTTRRSIIPWAIAYFAIFPVGKALVLERKSSTNLLNPLTGSKWLIFRVRDFDAFLSALEARGVPVRRMNGGVEST